MEIGLVLVGKVTVNPLRVLLTNDDGIDAEGIGVLAKEFESRDDIEVYVVAPDRERSTCSHGMSLARPVYVTPRGNRRYAVDGLPVDCVYVGTYSLLPEKPDVVVSGINHGGNLGTDVIYSGTVAGARQAALQGICGVATSLVSGTDFEAAAVATVDIALAVARLTCESPIILNLNFPKERFDAVQFGPLGKRNYPRVTSKRVAPLTGQTYYWLGGPPVEDEAVFGTDGWLVKHNIASATLLSVNQTDGQAMGVTIPEISHLIR